MLPNLATGRVRAAVKVISSDDLIENGGSFRLQGRVAFRVNNLTGQTSLPASHQAMAVYPVTQADIDSGRFVLAGGGPAVRVVDIDSEGIDRVVMGRTAVPVYVVEGEALGVSVPDAPTNLVATQNGASQINLTWNAVDGADGYYIERSDGDNSSFVQIDNSVSNAYSDTGLSPDIYYYRVRAFNAVGDSGYSNEAVDVLFLLRDEFTTPDAAPIASPRTCEPGPGTWTVTDTGNRLSVGDEKLQIGAGTTAFSLVTGQYSRANGLAAFMVTPPTAGGGELWRFGFTDGAGDNRKQGFLIVNNSSGSGVYAFSLFQNLFDPTYVQKYFVILRSTGAFFGGYVDGVPTLLYVDTSQSHALPQLSISNHNTTSFTTTVDNVTLSTLTGAQWVSDWALATSRTAAPATGQTGTMTANGLVEFTWTPASAEVVDFMVRRTDDNNCWIVRCNQAGSRIYLYQKQAGTETERGATGGVAQTWTAGTAYRIVVIAVNQSIQVITVTASSGANGAIKITYGSASFNSTETGVKVTGFATGANLVAWPRTGLSIPAPLATGRALKFLTAGDSRTSAAGWQPTLMTNLTAGTNRIWLSYKNYGVSAHKVADCKTKLQTDLPTAIEGIDYALLNIGVNDAINLPFPAEATFKADYLACLDAIHSRYPSAWVGCMRVGARNYASECATVNGWIDYCITQRSFAHAGPDESVWAEGGDNYTTMTTDGLHYSAAGNAECAAQWQAAMGF